jgi:endogenous inhibitor of DNA gyrase (YacG/DUF329 family)
VGTAGRDVSPCPGCKKPVRRDEPAPRPDPFPFCSVRCQMVDLGRWFDEDYRIPDGEDQSGGGNEGAPTTGDDGNG